MANDPQLRIHRDWLSTIQPVGLVVSPPALVAAQAFPDKHIVREQQTLLRLVLTDAASARAPTRNSVVTDFLTFARDVLGWDNEFVAGSPTRREIPDALAVTLPEFGETLRPTFAVENLHRGNGEPAWALLVDVLPSEASFDDAGPEEGRRWHASPQVRLERLLRETGIPAGLLWNGAALRLVYAPRDESSGSLTWPVYALCEVQGRPLLSSLCMLLGRFRLFAAPKNQSLLHILRESRKYQNVVSTKLAGQVLEALNELLRGFQAANEAAKGRLLDDVVREDPDHVYGGLLAVLLRLVFLLYAEERGLMSQDSVYVRNYSLTDLFEKLRADAGRFPDTMDQRYGAWSRLSVLFRLIFDGAKHGRIQLPPRRGQLFDPNTWPFLEGRSRVGSRQVGGRVDVPKVSDGNVYRVLDKLLMLDGDRLSYRALDVEQIGSVYENMMGFSLERAFEVSIGVGHDHVVVGLEELLAKKGEGRARWLKEKANVDVTGKALDALKAAATIDDAVAALARRISPLTPRPIPQSGLYLQPTDERRRSGSHYTPRELTEPIVRTTLRPLLEEFGPTPNPAQLLGLKVCDPAMGSGAFLVETCRQLAEQLVTSWDVHGKPTDMPLDEDPLLFARRQVAQRCLYGVDKNPFAVDLAKLSLWLATLAKGHSFSFLDHAIRHGDSLVGLTREQIASFHWATSAQVPSIQRSIQPALDKALHIRREIQALSASDDDDKKRVLLRDADEALGGVRLVADSVVASFFAGENDKGRKRLRGEWETRIGGFLGNGESRAEIAEFVRELREDGRPVPCFHWEVEFPEVFETRGFDAIVGNPPFLGGKRISTLLGDAFRDWLPVIHEHSNSNADLVAHFYRRAFSLVRKHGAFGLIATNTIAQGDTRATGLRWICTHGGEIFAAKRRVKWPGLAAVIVSVVHVLKGAFSGRRLLDDREVPTITAFLFHGGGHDNPATLVANAGKSFIGSYILGMGFTFDDTSDEATPLAEMHRLIAKDPRNQEVIFPYIGGEEVNTSPTHAHHRYVINFGERSEDEARAGWPDLIEIVERKVKLERIEKPGSYSREWWLFARRCLDGQSAIRGLERVIVNSQVSSHVQFAFLPANMVFAHTVDVFPLATHAAFAALQSRPHEVWARFFASSLEDRLRYTPSDCFETFPFPENWETHPALEGAGRAYHDFRAALMVKNSEGLTKTHNRFHDPDECDPDILKLRALHAAMDRAVLDAYGFGDLEPTCEFLLDYEEEDDESVRARRKKKPWRYRWPDDLRDEVLARLLALNAQRAKEEAAAALTNTAPKAGAKGKSRKERPRGGSGHQGEMF